MPRVGDVYTAPVSSWNPAVAGVPIDPVVWNALIADIVTALSGSLARSGGSMAGPLLLVNGSAAAPSTGFGVEPSSGLYRSTTAVVRMALAGVDAIEFGVGGAVKVLISGTWYPLIADKRTGFANATFKAAAAAVALTNAYVTLPYVQGSLSKAGTYFTWDLATGLATINASGPGDYLVTTSATIVNGTAGSVVSLAVVKSGTVQTASVVKQTQVAGTPLSTLTTSYLLVNLVAGDTIGIQGRTVATGDAVLDGGTTTIERVSAT